MQPRPARGASPITGSSCRAAPWRASAGLALTLGLVWAPMGAAQAAGVTGDWRLSGSVTLSRCLDARLDGTRPASLMATAIKVRDRFAANAGLAQGSDRFSLDVIGTVANGTITGTFTGVRRGPGSLQGSLTGSLAGNALTLGLSAEIVGLGCSLAATLGGVLVPGDPTTFRVGTDVGQVLPHVRFDPGIRPLSLNNLLSNGRTVGEELAEAFDRLFGTTGSRLSQNPATGVASAVLPGRRFAFHKARLVAPQAPGTPLRQQVTPSLVTDDPSGTVTVTTTSGAQVTLVPAPLDLEAFLNLVAPLGINGVDVNGSQYLFTTSQPLSFSARFDIQVGSGGTTAGVAGQPDGTALSTYSTGETQLVNPLVVEPTIFMQAAAETLGATSVTQDFAGVISLVAGGQTTRLRPEFVVGASPAGARRALIQESTSAFVLDTGDGSRQRFFVIP